MVFFTCNACGQAIKKNQVEKHYTLQCRNCEVLSCMDCGKDFYGDQYLQHTKCISEEEKYGGKDFKPKSSSNKGEIKQQEWINHIKETIATTKVRPILERLLEQIITYPNVPRKKIKFQNFVKNCLKYNDTKLIEEAWEIFNQSQKQKSEKSKVNENPDENIQSEKRDELITNDSSDISNNENKKKKKKRKYEEHAVETKQPCLEEMVVSSVNNGISPSVNNDEGGDEGKSKFKWSRVILDLLNESPEKGMSIKKLQKKVTKQYLATAEDDQLPEHKILLKFHKKLKRIPNVTFCNDRVKILQD